MSAVSNSESDLKGPVFIKEPLSRIDFSNSTGAVVECRATGNPPPELIWVCYTVEYTNSNEENVIFN